MRQVKLQNKLTRVTRKATDEEVAKYSLPNKMATKPASEIPTKDLPSKLNAAVEKAKSYKSFDNMPKMKAKITKKY
jgi:hypothetical protein